MGKHSGNERDRGCRSRVLAACQLSFSFKYAGMDSRWIFSSSKLIKQLFILVHDSVPIVKIANPIRSAPAEVFSKIRIIFNKLDFRGQIGGICKQEPVASHDFRIERIVMRQNTVAEAEGLKECRVGSAHHMAVNICV